MHPNPACHILLPTEAVNAIQLTWMELCGCGRSWSENPSCSLSGLCAGAPRGQRRRHPAPTPRGIRPAPGQGESLADNFIPWRVWKVCPKPAQHFVQSCQERVSAARVMQRQNPVLSLSVVVSYESVHHTRRLCVHHGLLAACLVPGCEAGEDSGWREM